MFASLKKKIQEEGGTGVIHGGKLTTNSTPTGVKTSAINTSHRLGKRNSTEGVLRDDSPIQLAAEEQLFDDASASREDIVELLLRRTRQAKVLESRLSELTGVLKEKNQMIEKLELALEKQQDALCQRLQEVNEQYNAYRAKTADTIAAAVKKKEDELKTRLKDMGKMNDELHEKVVELERYRERFSERQDVKDELEAFSTQELTKVKHLLLKAQEELKQLKSEKVGSDGSDMSKEDVDIQLVDLNTLRSELETRNAVLCATNSQLCSDLAKVKEDLVRMTNNSASSQEEWLEKQFETEKCISNLEESIQSLRVEIGQRDANIKGLSSQVAELTLIKSQLKAEQERANVLQAVVDEHHVLTMDLQLKCDQTESECKEVKAELAKATAELEACHIELRSCRSELDASAERNGNTIEELDRTVHQLTNDHAALQRQISELEERKAGEIALVEADVTARLRLEMTSLEDQIQDKNRVIKKQEQRLADLKKLLQRELKMLPPEVNTSSLTTQLQHVKEHGNGVLKVDIAAAAAGVHTSAQHHSPNETLQPSSPATLAVSEIGAGLHRNRIADSTVSTSSLGWSSSARGDAVVVSGRTRRQSHRSGTASSHSGTSSVAVMMTPVDSEYDFMRELNFKYLRHVVLKFMLSRETEALQLIKAISMLLHFTPEEQKLIRDTLEWKKSWFGPRPQLPANGQQAKIIPPSY